jgi:acetyl-CoA carboxylase beta subunit
MRVKGLKAKQGALKLLHDAFPTFAAAIAVSAMLAHDGLAALKSHFEFSPTGEVTGNLTIGRGRAVVGAGIAPVPIYVAIIENKIASGSLGVKECDKLASLFKVVAVQKCPLLMYIDSAGARISEGLPALGAFRHMYRAALAVASSGAAFTAVCGANCFGGASMVAALAGKRVFSANTRFAMSGPSILAQAAGISALDNVFMAMSMLTINAESRTSLGGAETMATSSESLSLIPSAAGALIERHVLLGERLTQLKSATDSINPTKVERKDLAKLYSEGYRLEERYGVLSGEATIDGQAVTLAGVVGGKPLGALRAWRQADELWKMLPRVGVLTAPLHLLVDCESHAASLDDERILLSAYLADLACALQALAQAGVHIETTVLGKLGGGVYVALCSPVARVNMLYGTEIQLLPGRAIATILGDAALQKHEFEEYKLARVADQELKLGLLHK